MSAQHTVNIEAIAYAAEGNDAVGTAPLHNSVENECVRIQVREDVEAKLDSPTLDKNSSSETIAVSPLNVKDEDSRAPVPLYKKFINSFNSYFQEILCVAVFVILMIFDPVQTGLTYLYFEIAFIVTMVGALAFKKYGHPNLARANFFANRLVGFAQPLVTICQAAFIDKKAFDSNIEIYVALIVDLAFTFWSSFVFIKYFRKSAPLMTTRLATTDDIEALLAIERSAFPDPNHQASRETILRRLKTSPRTTFVAVHRELGIVGSIYGKLCRYEEIVRCKYSWDKLNNGGDFTPPKDYDSYYVVGIQAMRGIKGVSISKFLELAAITGSMKLGCKGGFGGPRIPGYHKSTLPLDEYVYGGHDKVLCTLLRNATIPGLIKAQVVTPLVNYWDDPDSRNCAALMLVPFPWLFRKVSWLPDLLYWIGSLV
ncbi:hypothetical protein BKA69DRAFT_1096816 [Paraphysoderma sedebokerense]|nr:hypothetical protein BKA69DRAFT_1096816 [Paraphysoderma sedebokerense]